MTTFNKERTFLSAFCWLAMFLVMAIRTCPAEEKGPIVVYDFVPALSGNFSNSAVLRRHYDEVLLVTCLQAIVNRTEGRLFVRYNAAPDDFWFGKMREPGAWMADRKVVKASGLSQLLTLFPGAAKGLVIWDERVPATSNVAATVAGVEDLLALRYDPAAGSLYRELTASTHALPVVRQLLAPDGSALFTGKGSIPGSLKPSSGSAKNDAYLWLLENYIKPGKTNPRVLGYYIDANWLKSWQNGTINLHTLNNLDYILAHRGIVCDLDFWTDETPVDDRAQVPGTDFKTMTQILRACYDAVGGNEMIACHGFAPWAFKYTDYKTPHWDAGGSHHGVETEWNMANTLSSYNVYLDADAIGYSSLVNASFYQHYPLPRVIPQAPPPTRASLIEHGVLDKNGRLLPINYYANFQGDYDSAAWAYWELPKMWDDPARGTLPMSWGMNPNLADRFAFGMAYIRQTAKPEETWVADEGAGYLTPANLLAPRPSGLPDGLQAWANHCKRYYQQWDLRVTGFNIDGTTPVMNEKTFAAYRQFSPGGVGLQLSERGGARSGVIADVPFVSSDGDLPGSEDATNLGPCVDIIAKKFADLPPGRPAFLMFRSILRRPSFYAGIEQQLAQRADTPAHKLVDLPTLMWLVKEYHDNPGSHLNP